MIELFIQKKTSCMKDKRLSDLFLSSFLKANYTITYIDFIKLRNLKQIKEKTYHSI